MCNTFSLLEYLLFLDVMNSKDQDAKCKAGKRVDKMQ